MIPQNLYEQARAWPFEEAHKLLAISKDMVTFETGYGPSGLPHIGTFGEVVRTSMVRHAFSCVSHKPSRLICFSDDMDGLRKIPDNIPNSDKMIPFLHYPLTSVPDPFGCCESFGAHNNQRLREFLDNLGIDYTFMSATHVYQSGFFDKFLLSVLRRHQEILQLILPTLGAERQKTYSPFLPISSESGRVLQVAIEEYREKSIVFRDESGKLTESPVTGGQVKLQWKVDWGMRWCALGVDYEMSGKDLIDSVTLAQKVCHILGGTPPQNLIYEHFLDEEGKKISKSKGNGVSIEDWVNYAPIESLAYFMYNAPRRAKKLYFDVIPRYVDECLSLLSQFPDQEASAKLDNPLWHVYAGHPPDFVPSLTFSLLLNLASVCHAENRDILWRFVRRLYPHLSAETHPFLDDLLNCAVRYYHDKVAPAKQYRAPLNEEKKAFQALSLALCHVPVDAQKIQTIVYEVGKNYFPDLKQWFSCFYEVLLGQKSGPRVGSFIALYGIEETRHLISEKIGLDPIKSV